MVTLLKPNLSKTFDPHETVWSDALAQRPLASFQRRLAAYFCDFVFAGILFLPLDAEGKFLWHQHIGRPDEKIIVAFDFHDPWSILWLVIYFGISTWYWNGSTMGKRLLSIRVFSLVGPRITLWQGIERALGYGASALELGFGFFQYFIHHNHQCVHDRIAETVVLFVGKARTVKSSPELPERKRETAKEAEPKGDGDGAE